MKLYGPRPLDLGAADRAARALLARWRAGDLPEGDGKRPGLWLIVDDEGALRGFWASLGEPWLEDGPSGGRIVPLASLLLDALVEEIWWERFPVAPKLLGAWRPVIVLEWPSALADRSSLPPPGLPAVPDAPDEVAVAADAGAGWLDDEEEAAEARRRRVKTQATTAPQPAWPGLPADRSIVSVFRGSMRTTGSVHEGRYELVCLPPPQTEGLGVASAPGTFARGWPLEEWLEVAATGASAPPPAPALGYPLALPGGRAGFPLAGWLTRDLEVAPPSPAEAAVGHLVPRDTRSRLLGQALLAVSVTVALLFGTLAFSATSHWLARPVLESATPPIRVDAQPALSVCSADHGQFVARLRCQVRHLAAGGAPGEAACGEDPGDDLQAAYCGLRDRGGSPDPARVAAAQACFEVLGGPFEYAVPGGSIADPERLLGESELQVRSLADLVGALDAVCDDYRGRVEAALGGAVLAAHVSGRGGDGNDLRDLVFGVARSGIPADGVPCLDAGRERPLDAAGTLPEICGTSPVPAPGGWAVLGGRPPEGALAAVGRYERARFPDEAPSEGLWACHRRLTTGASEPAIAARWNVKVAAPSGYAGRAIGDQLALDAVLLGIREDGLAVSPCWREVDRLLATYAPVHPLGGGAGAGWPSAEQQVCGNVCASAFHVTRAGDTWVTLGGDLQKCLDDRPPPTNNPHKYHEDRLDALRIPWNYDREDRWVTPDASDLCAFNLLAQERLPGILPEGVTGPLWAGEVAGRTGIAGGPGDATASAEALSRYGRNRSSASCASVAAQCFTAELFDVLADERLGPHQWKDTWRRSVAELPRRSAEELAARPWCRLVRPYVSPDGKLPEGELDLPCAVGVEDTRARVLAVIDRIASGAFESPGSPEVAP